MVSLEVFLLTPAHKPSSTFSSQKSLSSCSFGQSSLKGQICLNEHKIVNHTRSTLRSFINWGKKRAHVHTYEYYQIKAEKGTIKNYRKYGDLNLDLYFF